MTAGLYKMLHFHKCVIAATSSYFDLYRSMYKRTYGKTEPQKGVRHVLNWMFNGKGASTCPQQQLRDLREQYARLQDDYKNKLLEVSCLRTEAEKLKQTTREAVEEKDKLDIKLVDALERLKAMESEKDSYEGGYFKPKL